MCYWSLYVAYISKQDHQRARLAIRYQQNSYYSLKYFIRQSNFSFLCHYFLCFSQGYTRYRINHLLQQMEVQLCLLRCSYASLPTAELCGSIRAGEIWMSREPYLNGPPYSDSGCGWWWLTGDNDPIGGLSADYSLCLWTYAKLMFSFFCCAFLVCMFVLLYLYSTVQNQ